MQRALVKPPKTRSVSATESATLVKNLFRAAFSSIAYIRNFFEEECFAPAKIGGASYYKIVFTKDKDVRRFVDWLEQGVFDALQKRYLEVVLLEIYSGNTSSSTDKGKSINVRKLLECFQFNVNYSSDGATLGMTGSASQGATSQPFQSRAQIKESTSEVLRCLVELSGKLPPLPLHHVLSIKLMYTAETPQDYEPPLFTKAKEEDMCWFQEKPLRVSAGFVTTPYHQLCMDIHSAKEGSPQIEAKQSAQASGKNKEQCAPTKASEKHTVSNASTLIVDVGGSVANTGRAPTRIAKTNCEDGPPPRKENEDESNSTGGGSDVTKRAKRGGGVRKATRKTSAKGKNATPTESAGSGSRAGTKNKSGRGAGATRGRRKTNGNVDSRSERDVHDGDNMELVDVSTVAVTAQRNGSCGRKRISIDGEKTESMAQTWTRRTRTRKVSTTKNPIEQMPRS